MRIRRLPNNTKMAMKEMKQHVQNNGQANRFYSFPYVWMRHSNTDILSSEGAEFIQGSAG